VNDVMTPSVLVEALGTTVRIDLAGQPDAHVRAVERAWQDAATTGTELANIVAGHEIADLTGLLSDLSQRVTLSAIAARRGELWMLHAAGVALPDGRVVVFVGPSGQGKTTASRALGSTYGYVSDETVGIDGAGRVWPYRKPLSIIERDAWPKVQRAPSEVGLLPLPDSELRLGAIVLLDRRPDAADDPKVEIVDLGDALEELTAQSSQLAAMPAPLQSIASLVAAVGGVQRVTYREAASLVPLVPALAGRAPQAAEIAPELSAGRTGRPAAYHRTPVQDALALRDPDRIAVFQESETGYGMLRVVAGVAPALWRAADGATLDDLIDAAVDAYGAPEGADTAFLVRAALDDLVAEGLIELRPARMDSER